MGPVAAHSGSSPQEGGEGGESVVQRGRDWATGHGHLRGHIPCCFNATVTAMGLSSLTEEQSTALHECSYVVGYRPARVRVVCQCGSSSAPLRQSWKMAVDTARELDLELVRRLPARAAVVDELVVEQ
jgi:hypothetical protein